MKKLGLLAVLMLAVGLAPMAANAECVTGSFAKACADESGVLLDGDAGNPDPLDGYVQLNADDQTMCFDDDGGASTPEEQEGDCYSL